jgi:hypothetical protein
MSAVLAALFPSHRAGDSVRTRLVTDGFPTDRVELTSREDLGPADMVPADSLTEKLVRHFTQFFPGNRSAQLLSRGVLEGHAVITVQPRGEIETRRALEILEQAGPMELRERDLEKRTMERAASPSQKPLIPGVRKILIGPTREGPS